MFTRTQTPRGTDLGAAIVIPTRGGFPIEVIGSPGPQQIAQAQYAVIGLTASRS